MENYAPFLTGIKSINIDYKKDFSFSFKTFDVILPNVTKECNWKSSLNLLDNVRDVA